MDFLFRRARTQIVLNYPFFGSLIGYLPFEATESVALAATDGKAFLYHPTHLATFVEEDVQRLMAVILHEVGHIALGHLWRQDARDTRRWNYACDYAINSILRTSFGYHDAPLPLSLPGSFLYKKEYDNLSAEEIYERLETEPFEEPAWEEGVEQGDWSDHTRWTSTESTDPFEQRQQQEVWRQRMVQAQHVHEQRSNIPHPLARAVDAWLSPRLSYHTALSRFLQPQPIDYSFDPPDLRFPHSSILLPDLGGDGLLDFVVAVDTSGSTQDALPQFFAETQSALAAYAYLRVHYAACDYTIRSWQTLSYGETPQPFLDGGSMTNFRPVFQEIEERGIHPSVLVYFTDTMGTFPPAPPPYPVLWVTNYERARVPFGTLCYLSR